ISTHCTRPSRKFVSASRDRLSSPGPFTKNNRSCLSRTYGCCRRVRKFPGMRACVAVGVVIMFPITRLRRLRQHPVLRDLVRETSLTVHDLIFPLFVRPGKGVKKEIASMPGNFQLSVDRLVEEVGAAAELGVRAFILFGIPASKDAEGSSSWDDEGIVQT